MSERSRSDALVGRRHELAALRGAVDRAAQGSGGAVVVLGEAGIGKSRLLAEVSHRAAAHGMEVLVGYAVPGGGSFRPIAAALADRLRERPGSVDHGVDGRRDPRLEDDGLRLFLPALDRLVPAWTAVGRPPRAPRSIRNRASTRSWYSARECCGFWAYWPWIVVAC